MKIVHFEAENFKRLRAVSIDPAGSVITIGGKNGAGKSSVLDAIWVGLVGKAVAPAKPVRAGEEKCTIKLDLGELSITRTFRVQEDGEITTTVKVENVEGLRYGKPQQTLDELLGAIGFDPFEFVSMKPDAQAETLMELVPLPIDLDEFAELDASDFAKRRDVNRDIKQLEGQIAGIPKEDVGDVPDRQALVAELGSAGEHNMAIEREQVRREGMLRDRQTMLATADADRKRADELKAEAARILQQVEAKIRDADMMEQRAIEAQQEIDALPPLPEPLDVAELQEQIRQAENLGARKARQDQRGVLVERLAALEQESKGYTTALAEREERRAEALAKAKMPIAGLGFEIDEKGKAFVTFGGQPFSQISTAEQIRASTAIAMAANPRLRVLRIKDGSLLDDESMQLLAEMAEAEDYQLWIERVGTGGVGIVIEDGAIREPAEPQPAEQGAAE